ncbi:Coenzyme F420 hydrogenase/dehydrogenase, beta subunit C-terminal domain [uncultured Bacteroides sp.]|uniref:Coenzyme F420 hydrogenase/dehydrogenase, beta subunit C-terminal domain n=1 Tax=uncultured Bacteroides sp. TaxID=162156 RepID=UPI002675BBE4|nr:Coenzyme F420 hydrogenase/dehydrogenase, beta subunit C-terminal domain [uncultured Bacteroides sp.]
MIQIVDKYDCCGCSACVQVCPKQCISFDEDEQGFRYPFINRDFCIDCTFCEKVCPVLNQGEFREPFKVYAAINPNEEIRMKSSSGGIFTMIAEDIIDDGGVVFGARFDKNWEVIHDYVETKEKLDCFRGSKYIQSRIGETYKQVREFLKIGRKVLFSGTSCQITGLKLFLHKEYDNLLTIDVVCHGVPSPKIWREYLSTVVSNMSIDDICLKDKNTGWRDYSFTILGEGQNIITSEKASKNKYMMAFTRNLTLRPSCFRCPSKNGKALSDITLADFWGVEYFVPQMDDDKGTSLVCLNTKKGELAIKSIPFRYESVDYELCKIYNSCIYKSTDEPAQRVRFWRLYLKHGIKVLFSQKQNPYSLYKRILNRLLHK